MTKSKTSPIQRALLGTLLAASAAMTTPTAAYSDMVTDWNEIAIQTFPSTVLGPTQARFLGIVHATIYDAINAIDRKHQVYAIDIKAPPGASMEAAAATAAHDTLIKLFPVQQSALDTALAESLSKIPDGPAKRDGITVGKESAEKTVAAHANDGATAKVGSVGFFVCRSVYFWLIADTSLQLERTTNWRPDLSIIAPGRWVARMPGTGTLRRSSTPARIKAIVGKSRVAATRLQRLSFVFGALAMIGCTFFRSPRQRIFDQSEWQIGLPPVSK